MFKKRWKNWALVLFLLIGSNAITWHRESITKLLESQDDPGEVDVGILLNNHRLTGNLEEDMKTAQSYLSDRYYWVYRNHGEVPLPLPLFKDRTGYWFQPIVRQNNPEVLAMR